MTGGRNYSNNNGRNVIAFYDIVARTGVIRLSQTFHRKLSTVASMKRMHQNLGVSAVCNFVVESNVSVNRMQLMGQLIRLSIVGHFVSSTPDPFPPTFLLETCRHNRKPLK
jgi:hypothetical protein